MPIVLPTNGQKKREHLLALDGVRGYGFLAIFLGHYLSPVIRSHRSNIFDNGLYYVAELAWLAVPAFFVLSGYLIGGILFNTRNREGFFKVFYGRRMLRILPVYYGTLLVIACVDLAHGVHLKYLFWSHFIYIQNWMPGYTDSGPEPYNRVIHLWSLAIEEQFYLTWPLVVWFARDRRRLLKIVAILCAACWTLRVISPWIYLSVNRSHLATPTRVDAILLGVALALVADHKIYKRLQPLAKYAALAGMALWIISSSTHLDDPRNYYSVAFEITLGNFVVLALISAVIDEGSAFARICNVRWARWLGVMSYGLYVFHYTYYTWFLDSFRPRLLRYMPDPWDYLATAAIALAVTIMLGVLSFRFIELPALSLRKYLKYGPVRAIAPAPERGTEPVPQLAADSR